eukprot:1042619-Pyramimonas_sp.AAC.1
MILTTIVQDAARHAETGVRQGLEEESLAIVMYADDTLLVGRNQIQLLALLEENANAGARLGSRAPGLQGSARDPPLLPPII